MATPCIAWPRGRHAGQPYRRESLPTCNVTGMATQRIRRLDVDGVQAGIVGTAVWGISALLATLFGGILEDHGLLWWRDVAWAGVVIGLLGVRHVIRRRNRLGK